MSLRIEEGIVGVVISFLVSDYGSSGIAHAVSCGMDNQEFALISEPEEQESRLRSVASERRRIAVPIVFASMRCLEKQRPRE